MIRFPLSATLRLAPDLLFPLHREGIYSRRVLNSAGSSRRRINGPAKRETKYLGVPGGFPGKRSEKSSREPTRKALGFQRLQGLTWQSPRNSTPRWIGSA